MIRILTATALLGLVAACGGTQSALGDFEDRIQVGRDQAARINALPGTAFRAMPTSDSAVFTGSAGLIIDPVAATDDDDIVVIGDTRMTADFDAGTMTGTITNMQAATDITDNSADISGVDGIIRIGDNTSIIGDDVDDNLTNQPNEWYADYAGTLEINSDTYQVEGNVSGRFLGTRVTPRAGLSPVRAIVGTDDDGFAVMNGAVEEVPVTLELGGENG